MENFDKFCYIFVIVMVLLDRGITYHLIFNVGLPLDREQNLIARFILANKLWDYYFTQTVAQISVFVVLVSLVRYVATKIDKNYILLFPLAYSCYPVVNNTIVLIIELI